MEETIRRTPEAKKPLTPAQRRKRDAKCRSILRAVIQVLFFLLAPSLFTSAFTGVKQIFTAVGNGMPLELSGFARVLIVLCLFTVVFGRFFCGYACPFGALGDLAFFLSGKVQKKVGKKLPRIPDKLCRVLRYLPYGILVAIMLLCALGVYGTLGGWSPWDVFSLVTAGNLALGRFVPGLVLLILILIGMIWEPRFFCRFLCPMGAIFRLLPILPWAVLRRDTESCLKGCSACKRNCPMGVVLGVGENAGDCIRCGKCVDVCPKSNVNLAPGFLRGKDLWLTAAKALILFGAVFAIGATRI